MWLDCPLAAFQRGGGKELGAASGCLPYTGCWCCSKRRKDGDLALFTIQIDDVM
jgi:hypothetical protein